MDWCCDLCLIFRFFTTINFDRLVEFLFLFNEEKRNLYLSTTRTPLYLYSGIILVVTLIVFLTILNIRTQKQKAEYVNASAMGDVYLIWHKEKASQVYYFLRIVNIKTDSTILLV